MNGDSDNLRFRCAFSQRGIRNYSIKYWAVSLVTILLCGCILVITGAWQCIFGFLIVIIPSIYSLNYVEKLETESYLEITSDGILKCVYKWRGTAEYPVKEILSIEAYSAGEKKVGCVPPKSISGRNDPNLYPDKGVLVYFNRKWIKSIYPVFFNPEDIQGFICAINQKREEIAASNSSK